MIQFLFIGPILHICVRLFIKFIHSERKTERMVLMIQVGISEWMRILKSLKDYKTNDIKLSAFYNFIIHWIEEQLLWANYICIWGNL